MSQSVTSQRAVKQLQIHINKSTTYADISHGSTTWRVFTNHSRVWCRCELRRTMTHRDHRDSDRCHSDVLLHSWVLTRYQLLTVTSHSPHITNNTLSVSMFTLLGLTQHITVCHCVMLLVLLLSTRRV